MKMSTAAKPRVYRMTARAKRAQDTGRRILDAAKLCFESRDFEQVTLADIGRAAGVTEQTVIRRFKTKVGLLGALIERELPRVEQERQLPSESAGSLEAAVHRLVLHYDKDGRAMLNFLAQEQLCTAIARLLQGARRVHEEWVRRYCSAALGAEQSPGFQRRLMAATAATDIYVWKLLRLDRGLSRRETELTMLHLLRGVRADEAHD